MEFQRISIVLGILILLSSCSPAQPDAITIGFIGPLSGELAFFGLPGRNLVQIAVDNVNKAGGINGRPLHVLYEDSKCSAPDAASAAQKLLGVEGIHILLSVCSKETAAIIPIAEQYNAVILTAATNPELSSESMFRVSYSDHSTAQTAAQLLVPRHQTIGIIYEQTSYPAGLKNALRRDIESRGGIVIEEGVRQGEQDLRGAITRLLSQEPDALFLDPDSPIVGIAMISQVRELGYTGPLYGNYFGSAPEVIALPQSEGLVFVADPFIKDSALKTSLWAQYTSEFGEPPAVEYFSSAMHDALLVVRDALEQVGEDPIRMKEHLRSGAEFQGILGTFSFDEQRNAKGMVPSLKKIQGGQAVLIDESLP